ncbi:MAG: PAS domain S-box protein [Desulfobulbaceae bacterium]|nr:PAS domain S-box protein [Desulfobulbaceae bacterium]
MADQVLSPRPSAAGNSQKGNPRRRHIFRVTVAYGVIAALWILLSDSLLAPVIDPVAIQRLSTVKGLLFVIVTTLLLFYALRAVPDRPGAAPAISEASRPAAAPWSGGWVYLFAVTATLATLLVRLAIPIPITARPMMVLFMFPIILSALAGGLRPGLVATLVAALAVDYYAIAPLHSLRIAHPHDLFQWSFLLADGVLVSVLSEVIHRQRRQTESSQQLQAVTLASIGDGVISTDHGGRVTFMNPEAERLTGWRGSEAVGQPLPEIFRICTEDTLQPLLDPVAEIVAGKTTEFSNHTLLLARDGRELPIQASGSTITLADGTCHGVVVIFRDDSVRRQSEAVVQEERALYQDLVNNQPGGIYRIRVNPEQGWEVSPGSEVPYRFDIISEHFCEILEVSRQELEADPGLISRRIHPDDQASFSRINREANTSLTPFNWEGRILTGGRSQWLQFQSLPRQLDNGDILWTGLLSDISARKQSEISLRESQAQFALLASLLERSSQPFSQGFPDGRLGFVNQAYLELVGYSAAELAKLNWQKLTAPEWRQQEQELIAQLNATGQPIRYEKEYIRKDGSLVPIELLVHLARGEDGNPLYYYSFITDLSARKKVELALRESEARMRAISDNLPDGYIYQSEIGPDATPRFHYISAGVTEIHGLTPEEVLGDASLLYRQVDSGQVEALAQAEQQSFLNSTDLSFELHVCRPDQTWRWLAIRSRPGRKSDGQLVWDGVAIDITARKSLEGQLFQAQKMESIGRLAGGVAHDFNNMLTVIGGHTELALLQTSPDDPRYASLQEIESATQRSANLTRQLLAFARKQTVSPKVLDLNETLGAMLKMLQRLIGENIDLAWLPGRDLWPVKIDPSQIDQLLANLAVNARDAIAGVGKVTIETANHHLDAEYCLGHPDITPGDYVELAVSDSGSGIDGEVMTHLFEPFFTTKREGEGTGLGLATVYGIIKQNQGAINVYSEAGKGTTFRIYLPRHEEANGLTPAITMFNPAPGGSETVLIVEDDPAILDLGKRFIARLGYRILTANSPGEAIRLVATYPEGGIDLLVTDVVMPEMNGKQLAARLRELLPGLKCLFMSGYTADAIARQGVLDEGICFLAKPFSSREMAVKIREALGQKAEG